MTVKVNQSKDWTKLALIALRANRVPLVWGPPGIGKTDMSENLIHRVLWNNDPEAKFVSMVLSMSDPTDVTGPLAVITDKAKRLVPEVIEPVLRTGKGTILIDEVTTGTAATQAATMRGVQSRIWGDTKLPDAVRIIMAANPADIAAGGSDLVTPMANRVVHLHAGPPSGRDWGNWLCSAMIDSEEARRTASMFAAFISAKSDLLLQLPEDESRRAGAWPSPRSWHSAADCYAEALKAGDPAAGVDLVAGAVGEACAVELSTFLQHVDLPNPRELLDGRATWKAERHRADRANAVLRAIASEAVNGPAKDKQERIDLVGKAWEIVNDACQNGLTDIAFGAAVPLNNWRITKSGAPRALGVHEAQLTPRFFEILSATSGGGR